jgi:hypothetical protein
LGTTTDILNPDGLSLIAELHAQGVSKVRTRFGEDEKK